jgi:hypothetical protein
MRPSSEGLPLPEGASTIAATPATARAIMSGRPGRVKAFYAITIPRPRDAIKVKDSEEPRRLPRDLAHPGRRVRVRRPA